MTGSVWFLKLRVSLKPERTHFKQSSFLWSGGSTDEPSANKRAARLLNRLAACLMKVQMIDSAGAPPSLRQGQEAGLPW